MEEKKYNHKEIEKRWQEKWEKEGIYRVDLDKAPKSFYNLMMFPYPSAEGLHVGNMYAFVHSDVYGRFMRLMGKDVFEPIGLDGFGIHSENYAIKIGEHIKDVSARTEKRFYNQLRIIGNAYDWSRKLETYNPNYYKWTQWLFLKMYEKGLAYRKGASVNWCPECKTVLSDEQVVSGKCERCDSIVEKKQMDQWFFKITDYAEKLLNNLDWLDWTEEVKTIQKNWIGRSEGVNFKFQISNFKTNSKSQTQNPKSYLEVFTTRIDTIFGCTYLVVAPEHELFKNQELRIKNQKEVEEYINKIKNKSDLERTDLNKDKTGVELKGIKAVNPFNGKEVPIFVADYVLGHYGTGAVMAVPAHDERDYEFAKKYNLPAKKVVLPEALQVKIVDSRSRAMGAQNTIRVETDLFTGNGILIDSGEFSGLTSEEAREKMAKWLEEKKLGGKKINYKLRDWCVSRQRYWGPPIPMIECEKCGWVPVPEKDLPVELPDMDDFLPDGSGKGPLNKVEGFVNTICPKCGGPAKRETDVSDPFVDSCWYYMRYLCTDFSDKALDKERLKKWMPVDMYIGGKEHSVLHLLYSRFITMVMHELGYAQEEEPFKKFRAHGLLIKDGAKMSKSKGNVINPDDYIEKYGADTVRMYLMFLGDMRQGGDWRDDGVNGMHKFVNRIYSVFEKIKDGESDIEIKKLVHKTIKTVKEDLENLKYNTAISKLMVFVNNIQESNCGKEDFGKFLIILAPFAPHMAEELYEKLGSSSAPSSAKATAGKKAESIFKQKWPEYDSELIKEKEIDIPIQINGKVRDMIKVSVDAAEDDIKKMALEQTKIKKWLGDKDPKKVIYVKGRMVSIVI